MNLQENEDAIEVNNNDVIRSMVDSILQGDSIKAKSVFDSLVSAKVSDAIDNKKVELAQNIYSRE